VSGSLKSGFSSGYWKYLLFVNRRTSCPNGAWLQLLNSNGDEDDEKKAIQQDSNRSPEDSEPLSKSGFSSGYWKYLLFVNRRTSCPNGASRMIDAIWIRIKLPDTWLQLLNSNGDEDDEKKAIQQDSNRSPEDIGSIYCSSTDEQAARMGHLE
jgi:hypothetical protein